MAHRYHHQLTTAAYSASACSVNYVVNRALTKNWLFTGSERAGKRAAAIQSLLATAALNGLDPAAWLRTTLEKLPTCLNSDIDSLLPLRQFPLLDHAG